MNEQPDIDERVDEPGKQVASDEQVEQDERPEVHSAESASKRDVPAETEEESGDLTRLTRRIRGPLGVTSVATMGLLILASFYTLYFARVLFLPIVLALFFDRLLAPVVRSLKRLHVPTPVGAGLILVALVSLLAFGIFKLSGPASEWIEQAPEHLQQAEYKLRGLTEPVQQVQEAAREVEEATQMGEEENQPAPPPEPSLSDTLLNQTRAVVVGAMVTLFLLYFLLASGDLFLRKLISVLPEWGAKRTAVEITHRAEQDLSTYLLTVTLINAGLGGATALAMWILGMPNPVLWGIMAMVLNFIPYVGAVVGIAIVGLVAIISFDTTGQALLVPAIYFALTALEGYLVTPMILGQRFTMNPVAIFVSLVVWGWIWGVPGALLAVPLLVAFKVLCDNIDVLKPLGAFLER